MPLDKLESLQATASCPGIDWYIIGDFMLNSDEIIADIFDIDAPIMLRHAHEVLAKDFDAFLSMLVTGSPA